MQNIHSILKEYWGFTSFRSNQEEIINSVLAGRDTLALLPTGGGKSICFQVPALMQDGICLVVSPLIALMKDQVSNLRKKGINAFAIYSGMTRKDVISTLKIASSASCKLLYVSPERLETKLFLEYLPALSVSLLAIDEAHCISQWGYDFRPPYLRIAALREQLPGVPVLALTASATPTVQQDICERLHFKEPNILRQSFERPNLSYSVFKIDSKINKLVEILSNVQGSSIVYCRSRKRTKEIASQLQSYRIDADYYHAGLLAEERSNKQENWVQNKIRAIVCTNAFGMGIDKPDVRAVVHVDMPDCLENYYQEAGRAGRDGKKAYAVLLHQEKDLEDLTKQALLRFPVLEEIRTVYQSLVNFLQVPAGSGAGNYYDFDLPDFLKKFKLPAHLVINSLKVLEQENWLSFNEQVFLSSRLMFTCNKTNLYEFEKSNPALEPLIKALLRTYEGIFDQDVNIHEKTIAYLLRIKPEALADQLKQLAAFNVIAYTPQKDTPQLFFIENRVKGADLEIDMVQYNKRKQLYISRLDAFFNYIRSGECRSKITGNYFGDLTMKPCGICDNCLRQKKQDISAAEFEEIMQRILSSLSKPVFSRDLVKFLTGIQKEKAWKVIEFLQAERKIEVNEEGMVKKVYGL